MRSPNYLYKNALNNALLGTSYNYLQAQDLPQELQEEAHKILNTIEDKEAANLALIALNMNFANLVKVQDKNSFTIEQMQAYQQELSAQDLSDKELRNKTDILPQENSMLAKVKNHLGPVPLLEVKIEEKEKFSKELCALVNKNLGKPILLLYILYHMAQCDKVLPNNEASSLVRMFFDENSFNNAPYALSTFSKNEILTIIAAVVGDRGKFLANLINPINLNGFFDSAKDLRAKNIKLPLHYTRYKNTSQQILSQEQKESYLKQWKHATLSVRKDILRNMRVIDPKFSLELIKSDLDKVSADTRSECLLTFNINLSDLDRELLTHLAFNDRSREVKRIATKFLLSLPLAKESQEAAQLIRENLFFDAKKAQVVKKFNPYKKVSLPESYYALLKTKQEGLGYKYATTVSPYWATCNVENNVLINRLDLAKRSNSDRITQIYINLPLRFWAYFYGFKDEYVTQAEIDNNQLENLDDECIYNTLYMLHNYPPIAQHKSGHYYYDPSDTLAIDYAKKNNQYARIFIDIVCKSKAWDYRAPIYTQTSILNTFSSQELEQYDLPCVLSEKRRASWELDNDYESFRIENEMLGNFLDPYGPKHSKWMLENWIKYGNNRSTSNEQLISCLPLILDPSSVDYLHELIHEFETLVQKAEQKQDEMDKADLPKKTTKYGNQIRYGNHLIRMCHLIIDAFKEFATIKDTLQRNLNL